MTEQAKRGMTRFGVGPRWVAVSLLCCLPFAAARILWPEVVHIPLPRPVVVGAAVVLLAAGLTLFVAALVRLQRGFPRGELFTAGAYALCRHPIYGSWVVLNVPGIALLADNWAGLLAPLPMYVALRVMVREEEAWLERTFGDAYRAYRERVRPVLPLPRPDRAGRVRVRGRQPR
jgi:protein-S-isoprenylcysteine O-methyltransferase Ste14